LRNVSKLVATITNYVSRSSFTTWTSHLKGEKLLGFVKHNANFLPSMDDESHRPNHVNFFHPRAVVLACHPNNVNDLHIHGSSCVTQNMFFYIFSKWHSGR
jgi:hypothetical protein